MPLSDLRNGDVWPLLSPILERKRLGQRAAGWTSRATIERDAGLGRDFLRNLERNPHHTVTLDRLHRLARWLNVPLRELVPAASRHEADRLERIAGGGSEGAAAPGALPPRRALGEPLDGGPFAPLSGFVSAGLWGASDEDAEDHAAPSRVPYSARYPRRMQRVFRVAGDSANLVYPHGSDVLVVSNDVRAARSGDLVLVERRSRGELELTIKRLRISPQGGQDLVATSSNPIWAAPISLAQREDDEVRIVGVVIGGWREEESAA